PLRSATNIESVETLRTVEGICPKRSVVCAAAGAIPAIAQSAARRTAAARHRIVALLLQSRSAQILQVDELLGRRQRRFERTRFPQQRDHLRHSLEIDLALARQHPA